MRNMAVCLDTRASLRARFFCFLYVSPRRTNIFNNLPLFTWDNLSAAGIAERPLIGRCRSRVILQIKMAAVSVLTGPKQLIFVFLVLLNIRESLPNIYTRKHFPCWLRIINNSRWTSEWSVENILGNMKNKIRKAEMF